MPSKYNNQPVTVDGIRLDSKMEARRYEQLLLLEQAGEIRNLQLHPRFVLQEKFPHKGVTVRAILYEADFSYEEKVNGQWWPVVEDVKGVETAVFKLKQKLFWRQYPIYELRIIKDA